jgi:phage gp29-like protein
MTDIDKAALKTVIATVRRDITHPYFTSVMRQQDDTLLQRGGGKGLKIYDEIERDAKVFSSLQKRKLAVIGRPWQVDPASTSSRDKAAAEMVKRNLMRINFDTVTLNALDAVLKGYSVGEVIWGQDGKEFVIERILPRNARRFTFDLDFKPRMLTWQNLMVGEELPERKFIVHSYGGKDGSPFGLGLGTRLFWPAFFKRQDISSWLVFLDKFASPTAVGKYNPGAPASDVDDLMAAMQSIAQETSIAIPEGMVVEFLEASRSGGTDAYERMARYMDEQIEEIVLGDSGGKGSGGAIAAAAITKKEVRIELVKADADLLSDTLNASIAQWLVDLNMPGAGVPRISRIVEEPTDLLAKSERDKNIHAIGYRPTLEYVHETYGGTWERVPEPGGQTAVAVPAASAAAALDADFAESDMRRLAGQIALETALTATIDSRSQKLQPLATALLVPLIDALEKATSFEEAFNVIAEAFPMMDSDKLTELLGQAEFVSQILGQNEPGDQGAG